MDVFGTFVVKTFGTLKFAFLSEVKQRELLPLTNGYDFPHGNLQTPGLGPGDLPPQEEMSNVRARQCTCVCVSIGGYHIYLYTSYDFSNCLSWEELFFILSLLSSHF